MLFYLIFMLISLIGVVFSIISILVNPIIGAILTITNGGFLLYYASRLIHSIQNSK